MLKNVDVISRQKGSDLGEGFRLYKPDIIDEIHNQAPFKFCGSYATFSFKSDAHSSHHVGRGGEGPRHSPPWRGP